MPLNDPPKRSSGRPRKHSSAAAIEAKKQSDRRRYLRSLQPRAPADFIFYEPPPADLPTETPPSGLRTSPDIRIPLDDDARQTDALEYTRSMSLTRQPLRDDNEVAAQIKEIQMEEEEFNIERGEYDAAITQRLSEMEAATVGILMGMRSANTTSGVEKAGLETLVLPGREAPSDHLMTETAQGISDNRDRERDKEPLRVCFSTAASIDEPIVTWGNDSVAASPPSNISANIQRSCQSTISLHTPSQKTLSLQSSTQSTSRQTTSKGSRSFPSQKNNLMSWVKSLPERQSPDTTRTSSPSTALGSPRNAPSSSPSRPESVVQDIHPAPDSATSSRSPVPAPAAPHSPTQQPSASAAATANAEPSTPPNQTAIKLAKQLRNFQGCTHEQHNRADRLHQEHHQRPDVHSKCSSLQEITDIIRGGAGESPLPDVLARAKSRKLMKPMEFGGLDCKAAFEGISPVDLGTRDENLPRNLCLSQHHTTSRKDRRAKEAFDIDSTCCFPTSLAVARQGIFWFPAAHPFMNLTGDIHFGLRVPSYDRRGTPTQKYVPLHKIPHYCFGSLMGMNTMDLFIFFPALHAESDHEHSTFLSEQDYELWYDAILAPVIHKIIRSSNALLHIPATARIANADAIALSAESLARKDSARQQLLTHPVPAQYLDALWTLIVETITENPACHRFQGATLFMHTKNTKLETMVEQDLTAAYDGWEHSWSQGTDPQFYNKDRTFVDLAKQVTSEDSNLPYDQLPADHEAEVYLWKKCCLDAYATTRTILNADNSPAKGNPKRTTYVWATMRDSIGQTFFAAPRGQETQEGLIYSQFYALIKTPFDTTKVYVFDNESLENLALDPGYIRSLQQEGGGITFSKRVCEFAYLHSKNRAHVNLVDNRWKSYGVREEHRISLTMMEEVYQQWRQWDLYDDEVDTARPLPYYVVPTKELLDFLYAQINKYCFLFEHVLAHTAMTYSLPETIVMVTALRALRFCYTSNLLQRESLLYKDRWEIMRNARPVVKEGLGMRDTMERCGLGWFLPKFNWATWRLAPPHGENILVGNVLMHDEYRRRWRAVKDLRDVYVRFNQAESWYARYHVRQSTPLLAKWLEYLHILNLEQFDTDLWKAILRSNKRSPELAPEAIARQGEIRFCYHDMRRMFLVNGVPAPPHFVTGNKMRFERLGELLDCLFRWEDGQVRPGWGHRPYRTILQKSFDLIERRLGSQRANRWLDEFFYLVRLTHWVLPYASNASLITATKTSRSQGLQGRMMWFSAVYADPDKAALPFCSQPRTLYDILRRARREAFGEDSGQQAWSTSQLIKACRDQGLKMAGQDETEDFWVVGKRSVGLKGFMPLWEQTQPPKLKMMEQVRGKSLDELEDLMSGFGRDYAGNDEPDGATDMRGEVGHAAKGSDQVNGPDDTISTGRSIMAQFGRGSRDSGASRSVVAEVTNMAMAMGEGLRNGRGRRSIMDQFGRQRRVDSGKESDASSSILVSSGSEFIPSTSAG